METPPCFYIFGFDRGRAVHEFVRQKLGEVPCETEGFQCPLLDRDGPLVPLDLLLYHAGDIEPDPVANYGEPIPGYGDWDDAP